ncbi:MAG: GNAT family N-acetyltransferase [Sulfobacillus sp.]
MADLSFTVRPLVSRDSAVVAAFAVAHWGSVTMVSGGTLHQLPKLAGFVAEDDQRWLGLVTYQIGDGQCEMVSLDSALRQQGVGTALLAAVEAHARAAACHRVWLVTTNDNRNALRFYLHRGYRLTAIHRDAVDRARLLKPEIPLIGEAGVAIHHELELAKEL